MRPRSGKGQTASDLDKELLSGCLVTSLICFVLLAVGVWPDIFWGPMFTWADLGRAAGLGLLPCIVLGIFAVRRFSYSGVTGFVGASAGVSLYWYLRLLHVATAGIDDLLPPKEYPDSFVWLVPVTFVVLATAIAMLVFTSAEESP